MGTNSLLGNFEEIEASINPKEEIKRFIEDNYKTVGKLKISKKPNKNGKYVVDGISVIVKNRNITSLTNNMFDWGVITNDFYCYGCQSLTSLKGAPEIVGRNFCISNCKSVTSLQGAPKFVGRDFFCEGTNLTSLQGAPEKVGGDFDCRDCISLTSLKGAPEEVGGSFRCAYCDSLKTLEGAPKKVGGSFSCFMCKSLISLKGAPEEVDGNFDYRDCDSLTSSKGAPNKNIHENEKILMYYNDNIYGSFSKYENK